MSAGEASVGGVPVQAVTRHVALVDAYRPQACATLVGVSVLVAVAAVDRRLSVTFLTVTAHVAQSAQRSAAVGTDKVFQVPRTTLRLDTLVAEDYLHHAPCTVTIIHV